MSQDPEDDLSDILAEADSKRYENAIINDDRNAIKSFFCSLTGELFRDPVVCVDGQTYERAALLSWFGSGKETSPVTGLRLASLELIPNRALKNAIDEWKQMGDRNGGLSEPTSKSDVCAWLCALGVLEEDAQAMTQALARNGFVTLKHIVGSGEALSSDFCTKELRFKLGYVQPVLKSISKLQGIMNKSPEMSAEEIVGMMGQQRDASALRFERLEDAVARLQAELAALALKQIQMPPARVSPSMSPPAHLFPIAGIPIPSIPGLVNLPDEPSAVLVATAAVGTVPMGIQKTRFWVDRGLADGYDFDESNTLATCPYGPKQVISSMLVTLDTQRMPISMEFRATGNSSWSVGVVPEEAWHESNYLHVRGLVGVNSAGTLGGTLTPMRMHECAILVILDNNVLIVRRDGEEIYRCDQIRTVFPASSLRIGLCGFSSTRFKLLK